MRFPAAAARLRPKQKSDRETSFSSRIVFHIIPLTHPLQQALALGPRCPPKPRSMRLGHSLMRACINRISGTNEICKLGKHMTRRVAYMSVALAPCTRNVPFCESRVPSPESHRPVKSKLLSAHSCLCFWCCCLSHLHSANRLKMIRLEWYYVTHLCS
ncbi:unnamed protein product, partial [Protopolystoma xenopodis]